MFALDLWNKSRVSTTIFHRLSSSRCVHHLIDSNWIPYKLHWTCPSWDIVTSPAGVAEHPWPTSQQRTSQFQVCRVLFTINASTLRKNWLCTLSPFQCLHWWVTKHKFGVYQAVKLFLFTNVHTVVLQPTKRSIHHSSRAYPGSSMQWHSYGSKLFPHNSQHKRFPLILIPAHKHTLGNFLSESTADNTMSTNKSTANTTVLTSRCSHVVVHPGKGHPLRFRLDAVDFLQKLLVGAVQVHVDEDVVKEVAEGLLHLPPLLYHLLQLLILPHTSHKSSMGHNLGLQFNMLDRHRSQAGPAV